jgi:hypothetical protein
MTTLTISTVWGKNPADVAYLLDQEMAKAKIPYFAEMSGGQREYVFTLSVARDAAAKVQRLIDQLSPPSDRVPPARFRGRWTDIKPAPLSKAHQDHPWVFAAYQESASDRDDEQKYVAFLFRNKERTVFGIREWLGNDTLVRYDVLEKMAHRIVTESEYRRQFISDDPDLIDMWKRH